MTEICHTLLPSSWGNPALGRFLCSEDYRMVKFKIFSSAITHTPNTKPTCVLKDK